MDDQGRLGAWSKNSLETQYPLNLIFYYCKNQVQICPLVKGYG